MAALRPVAKGWHSHYGVKIIVNACSIRKSVNGRMKRFRLATFCPYCGFEPTENARRMHLAALEKILNRQRQRAR